MEVLHGDHIVTNLYKYDYINYYFTEDWKDCHWAVVLCFQKRNDFSNFVLTRKFGFLDGDIHDVGDCWQNVVNHELEHIFVNIVHTK